MREFVDVEHIIVKQKCIAISCNKCGIRHEFEFNSKYNNDTDNFHEIEISGGYASTFPNDMETISYALCSKCLENFVASFKIPVKTNSNDYSLNNGHGN